MGLDFDERLLAGSGKQVEAALAVLLLARGEDEALVVGRPVGARCL